MGQLTVYTSDNDTSLKQSGPDAPYYADAYLDVNPLMIAAARKTNVLLRFNFNSLSSSTIISAILSLYYYSYTVDLGVNDPVGRTITCSEVTETGWVYTEACWNHYAGTTHWTAAGGDYTGTNSVNDTVPASFGWMDWDITTLIQHFKTSHSGIANLILTDPNTVAESDYRTTGFRQGNYADVSYRPKLVITYKAVPQIMIF